MLMELDIFGNNTDYISASRAAEKTGYAADYIGQLCRSGKIPGKLLGRSWYVDFQALSDHRETRQLGKKKKQTKLPEVLSREAFSQSLSKLELSYTPDEAPLLPNLSKSEPLAIHHKAHVPSLGLSLRLAAITLIVIVAVGLGSFDSSALTPPREASASVISALTDTVQFFSNGIRGLYEIAFGTPVAPTASPFATEGGGLASTTPVPTPVAITQTAPVSQPTPAFSETQLEARLQAYVRSQVAQLAVPAAVVAMNTSGPAVNTTVLRQNILAQDTLPATVRQGDSNADAAGLAISSLQNNGKFFNPTLTNATISGLTASATSTFDTLSANSIGIGISTPATLLDVELGTTGNALFQSGSPANGAQLRINNTNTSGSQRSAIALRSQSTNRWILGNDSAADGSANNFFIQSGAGFNVTALSISQNGTIGLGTTTPSADLSLQQLTNGDTMISAVRATDSASAGDFLDYTTKSGQALFRVDNSGNLLAGGIINSGSQTITSTSRPQFRVQYDASDEWTASVDSTGTTTYAFNGSTPRAIWMPQSNRTDTFQFQDAQLNAILSIDTINKKVGIGTSTPSTLLTIASSTASQLALSAATANTNLFNFRNSGGILYIATSSPTTFATSTTPSLILDGTTGNFLVPQGYVGIGTTSPATKLQVQNSAETILGLTNSAASQNVTWSVGIGSGSQFSNGYLIIGKASNLAVANSELQLDGSGTLALGNSTDGAGLRANGANTLNLFGTLPVTTAGNEFTFNTNNPGSLAITSGNQNIIDISQTFAPASGGGTFASILIDPTINQAAGTTGITRGIYINPTLTASADYRALEVAKGNVILNSTAGLVGIGTTTPKVMLTISSSTAPQLMLTDGVAGSNPFNFRQIGSTLYVATSSQTNFATSTTPALTIDGTTGYVGIGTAAPTKNLSIKGGAINFIDPSNIVRGIVGLPSYDTSYIALQNGTLTESATNAALSQSSGGDTVVNAASGHSLFLRVGNGSFFSLDSTNGYSFSNANVGIGTTTPQFKLNVVGSGSQLVLSDGVTGSNPFNFRQIGSTLYVATSSQTSFATSTTPALTIDGTTGYLGIGVAKAAKLLEVNGTSQFDGTINLSGASTGITQAGGDSTGLFWNGEISNTGQDTANPIYLGYRSGGSSSADLLRLYTDSQVTPALFVKGSGNVGIGTTTSQRKLEVSNSNGTSQLVLEDNQGDTAANQHLWALGSNGGYLKFNSLKDDLSTTTRMVIDTSGNIGIGQTNPQSQLTTSGSVAFQGIGTGAGSGTLCYTAPTGLVSTSTTGCTGSSIRFKDNVENLSYTLSDIMKLRPVSFDYKPEMYIPGHQIGFIAEEMNQVVPEVVGFDASGQPANIDYGKLTSLLTEGIQEIARITGAFKDNLIAWLGDAANGIGKLFAREVHTDTLCVKKSDGTEICLTGDQLAAIASNNGGSYTLGGGAPSTIDTGASSTPSTISSDTTSTSTPDTTASGTSGSASSTDQTTP